jgi:hypothetical protein
MGSWYSGMTALLYSAAPCSRKSILESIEKRRLGSVTLGTFALS